ncbi:MAG: hypothetical protein PF637_05635 [Spirochaetes bacterium]|jgi:hypothetical protein|nr:hypothetical protein [Spirochaetota bacterium]
MSEKKKTVKKTVKKSAKKRSKSSKRVSPDIESRVEDYLYNPDTKEKIEPPKEEPVVKQASSSDGGDGDGGSGRNVKRAGKKRVIQNIYGRIALTVAKIIFFWVPAVLFSLIFVVLILAKAILSPSFVQDLAESSFKAVSFGTLQLEVKEFDPYRGFVIERILVTSGDDYDSEPVFSCEKLVLDYSFFSLFTGKVYFPEVGIYNPSIFLTENDSGWNVANLMRPSEKKPEEEKKEEEDIFEDPSEPAATEINLPISAEVLFNFILEDLYIKVRGKEMSAELTDFDINTIIDIPSFKRIPLGPDAVGLIRKFIVQVNPEENLNLTFKSDVVEVVPPLLFTFNLILDRELKKDSSFYSNFKAGTQGRPINFQGESIKPLTVKADYSLSYNAVDDHLTLDSFGVTFAGDRWLDLKGEVVNLVSEQRFNIVMAESLIDLNKLYPYYVAILKDESTRFGGEISLKPMLVKGDPSDVKAQGEISFSSIRASVPGFALNMPSLLFAYDVHYKDNNVTAQTDINMSRFVYTLDRYTSGSNTLLLSMKASTAKEFQQFFLNSLDMQLRDNRSGLNAFSIKLDADADISSGTKANLNISELVFRKDPMINTLPSSIGSGMKDIPLKRAVTMNMKAGYTGTNTVHRGTVSLGVQVPDYDVYDLRLATTSQFDVSTNIARIDSFRVTSASYGLTLNTNGYLNTNATADSPFADSDIRVSLRVKQNKLRKMYDEWKVSGMIGLNAHMKGSLSNGRVNGNILIEDLSLNNSQKDVLFDLEKMNMKFPFLYNFKSTFTGESKTAADKSKLISNRHFKEKENFTIKSIRAKHPTREIQYEYLKDFNAIMLFKNNSFDIEKLQATVLNGSIYMRDTFFYLADMDINNMEYNLAFDATNIDIGKLDDPNKKTNESDLSLTARLSGKGLNISESVSTKGYVTIYKIGEEFANNLMKALSTKKGKSMLGAPTQFVVDNAMALEKFYFYIDKGNIYAKVPPEQRLITKLTFIKVNDIEFVRMPVQEFMRNLSEGE